MNEPKTDNHQDQPENGNRNPDQEDLVHDVQAAPSDEAAPITPLEKPTEKPVEPAIIKQDIPSEPPAKLPKPEDPESKEPLPVRVVKDDELSVFERITTRLGGWGLLLGFLSLIAAATAAYFIFQQFKEMADQTNLAGIAARQARSDSNTSAIATQKQLKVFQGQLTEARRTRGLLESQWKTQQRPWVGLSGSINFKPPTFFIFKTSQAPRTQVNIDTTFALKNVGLSPAINANWQLWTLQSGNNLALPKNQMRDACSSADSETRESGTVIFSGGPDIVANVNQSGTDQIEWDKIRRIWLVGCVSYTSGVDTTIHHTRFWTVSYLIPENTQRTIVKDDSLGTEFTLPISDWIMIKTEAD